MPPGVGYPEQGPPPQGAGSLQQNVAAQELGGVPQDPAQAGGPQGETNPVAFHLASAADALVKTGPVPENLSALQQFLQFIEQLGGGGQGQPGSPPPQPAAPTGQAQAPAGVPTPQSGAPLPPPGSPLPS